MLQIKSHKFNENRKTFRELITPDIKHVKFQGLLNKNIVRGDIPQTVTSLKFSHCGHLQIDSIPESVTHLEIYVNRGEKIISQIIPPSVTNLIYWMDFNTKLIYIPPTVKSLYCSMRLIENLRTNHMKLSVTHLRISRSDGINLLPEDIPPTVTHLTLDIGFKQRLDQSIIPPTVSHLTVDEFFGSEINIDLDTKITCGLLNYDLFTRYGFRQISFKISNKEIIDELNEDYIRHENNVYQITRKTFDTNYTRIILSIHCTNKKSARNI